MLKLRSHSLPPGVTELHHCIPTSAQERTSWVLCANVNVHTAREHGFHRPPRRRYLGGVSSRWKLPPMTPVSSISRPPRSLTVAICSGNTSTEHSRQRSAHSQFLCAGETGAAPRSHMVSPSRARSHRMFLSLRHNCHAIQDLKALLLCVRWACCILYG